MKDMKFGKIDFDFFEMPIHRLLTEEETDLLKITGEKIEWISCKECNVTGGTNDGREFCSIKCFCTFNKIDSNSMELIKNEVLHEEAAKTGDKVIYKDEIYDVISTDFSIERLKKQFNVSYSYILKVNSRVVKLFDLEYPLRKMTRTEHLKWKQNKFKDETQDENNYEL